MTGQIVSTSLIIPQETLRDYYLRNQIRWLALFGSALDERFDVDSDIDLLVDFAPEARVGFVDLGRMQRELSELWDRPVDLVPRNGLKPVIRQKCWKARERFMRPDRLYLTDIAGFRNIAVHAYFSVDWSIVWNTATREVPLLRDQVQIILDSISDDTSDRTLPNAKS